MISLLVPSDASTNSNGIPVKQGVFPLTRWSIVVKATDADELVAGKALGELLQMYWQPLYGFARRSRLSPEDAEDAVQGFCQSLIRRKSLRSVDSSAGKLRSFLLAGLQNHMKNEFRDEHRLKRGGGVVVMSLEDAEAQMNLRSVTHDTPDKAFDRLWACSLLERVRGLLRAEYEGRGRGDMFALLEPALAWNGAAAGYEEIGVQLSMSGGAVTQAVRRLRLRFRKLLEAEITQTVDGPESMAEELNHLVRVLSEE